MAMRHVDLPPELNDLADRTIGAAIEVHRELGPGFLERTYEIALIHELHLCGLGVAQQVEVMVRYKGVELPSHRLDLVVESQIVLELKAVESVAAVHLAQMVSYLRAGHYPLGLLLNFNAPVLKDGIYRRMNKNHSLLSASPRQLRASALS